MNFLASKNKVIISTVLGIFLSTICFSQDTTTKHQVSLNASKFIFLFNEEANNLDISYRYSINETYNVRSALSLDYSSDSNAISDIAVKIGLDKHFLKHNNWHFYSGFDINYAQGVLNSTDRTTKKYALNVLAGFMYKIGDHFSLSTEPGIVIERNTVNDPQSFNPNANNSWTEIKLLNIGQVKIGFHF